MSAGRIISEELESKIVSYLLEQGVELTREWVAYLFSRRSRAEFQALIKTLGTEELLLFQRELNDLGRGNNLINHINAELRDDIMQDIINALIAAALGAL